MGCSDGEEEEQSVYLEWTAKQRPHRLRLLRQAWRFHRWITIGLWAMGFLVAIGIWVQQTWSVVAAMAIISTMFLFVPKRLSESDPEWLAEAFGVSLRKQQRAWWDTSTILYSSFWLPILGILILGMQWSLLFQTIIRLTINIGIIWWMSHILRTPKSTWGTWVGITTNVVVWGSWLVYFGGVS